MSDTARRVLETLHDPALSGRADINGSMTQDGRAAELSGELAFAGADVALDRSVGRQPWTTTRQRVVDGAGYVAFCPPPNCGDRQLWSAAPAENLSLLAALRGVELLVEVEAGGPSGDDVVRLVPDPQPVLAPQMFGFGLPYATVVTPLQDFAAAIELLTRRDGTLAALVVQANWLEFGPVEMTARFDFVDLGAAQAIAAPAASEVLAWVASSHGYQLAVPADWAYSEGALGTFDTFVAPNGSRELRVGLQFQPQATRWEGEISDAALRAWVEEDYGAPVVITYGGFGGVINVDAVGLHATVGGRPRFVLSGPLSWSGPEDCGDCWSRLDMLADPGHEDADAAFISFIGALFLPDN